MAVGRYTQLPAHYDLVFMQGDDFLVPTIIMINGVAQDLTDYTIAADLVVIDPVTKAVTLLPFVIVTDLDQVANAGHLTMALTALQTAALSGAYTWYMTWTDPDSLKRTIAEGTVKVDVNG
jgi:hypothetical protein